MGRARFVTGVWLALCLLGSPAAAQEWAKKMFDATSHDFGAVARGATVQHVFTIKNIFKEEVHISGVRSSCGCTVTTIDVQTLKTYEKAKLTAELDTKRFLGQRTATLTVTIDKPYYAEVQVQIDGYIRSDVVVEPGAVNFGSVDVGSGGAQKVAINYAGRSDWKILDVQSANPHLHAELAETKRSTGSVSYDLTLRLADNAPAGYLRDEVFVVTNDSRAPRFPIEVQGQVVADVTVSPSSLFLGVVRPGQKVTKRLIVRGKKPFRVLAVKCDSAAFEFGASDETKTLHIIPVTFVAGEKLGKISHTIQIETDLAGMTVPGLEAIAQIAE